MRVQQQPQLEELVQPLTGLFHQVSRFRAYPGDPQFWLMSSELNDISQVLPTVTRSISGGAAQGTLNGAGSSLHESEARIKAIAEGLERYACCVYHDSQFIQASAAELGGAALDLESIASCSEKELAHPHCPLTKARNDVPLRWVQGLSLADGQPIWLPAVMVYMHIPYQSEHERFWFPISTGCAAHRSYEEALLGAICEVIERDAISLTWLQRLSLPRLELDSLDSRLLETSSKIQQSSTALETLVFNATTDLGIPVIYMLQFSPENACLASLVMCTAGLDPLQCVIKALTEASASRLALQAHLEKQVSPKSPDEFLDVMDGASYMAHPSRIEAFDFLRESTNRQILSSLPVLATGNPAQDLQHVIHHLLAQGLHLFAVDLTTDEARRAGMVVVRVIIPELQPLSFSYRARFLGHPRLYDAPRKMGLPVASEADLNPWPQPFA